MAAKLYSIDVCMARRYDTGSFGEWMIRRIGLVLFGSIVVAGLSIGAIYRNWQVSRLYALWSDSLVVPCLWQLAQVDVDMAQAREVADGIAQVLKWMPRDGYLWLLEGHALCFSGAYDAAFDAYAESVRLNDSRLANLHLNFAHIVGCVQQASVVWEAISIGSIACKPVYADGWQANWQQVYLDADDFLAAADAWQSLERLDAAQLFALQAVWITPDVGDGYALMARLLAQRGAYAVADAWILQALEKSDDVFDWLLLGVQLARLDGRGEIAEARLATLLARYPERITVWLEATRVAQSLQRPQEALEILERVVTQFEMDADLWRDVGKIYQDLEAWDLATQAYLHTLRLQPEYPEVFFELGNVKAAQGDFVTAERWYVRALAARPEMDWWYVRRADQLRNAGRLDEALQVYEETARLFPDFALVYHQLAWAYRLNNQPEKAVEAIGRAGSLFGVTPPVYYWARAGLIYEWAGQLDAAQLAYQQVLLAEPDNSEALAGLERVSR